jgi:hypothetical protein
MLVGGGLLDQNSQSAILEQTNLQINRLERYKDFEQMDQTGEISLALDLYADEASLIDPEKKHALIIRAEEKQIKEELEDLFHNILHWDRLARPLIRYLCKYGDWAGEIVLDENRSGVSALRFMNIYNFTRIETRFGDLVGFFYQDELNPEPMFLHPWSCMHLRLTSFENIYNPYGKSILEGGRKAFKQLRLMEDAALIYRITRAPEKRKYKIPVGMLPADQVPEYMLSVARTFKRNRFYNPSTGTYDERYSPMTQEDDFYLPQRPDGSGPDIETLPGAENLDQIADIEYFKKKMISPLKIPFARVGIGEGSGEPNEKSLSSSSNEFAKAINWVQNEVAYGLTKVAYVHLALRGYDVEDIKGFELSLPASSAIDDLYRMETWQTRSAVMHELKDLGWFPKEWIVTNFTDLSPDEIEDLNEMEAEESGMGGGGGGLGGMGGGEELGDLEGDLGGEGLEGDLGGGLEDDLGGEEEIPTEEEAPEDMLEGYNGELEKKIITEMKSEKIIRSVKNRIYRHRRFARERKIASLFDNMVESNELDGLSASVPDKSETLSESKNTPILETIHDPNNDEELLAEWSVDSGERDQAIQESRDAIVGNKAEETYYEDEDIITEEDLPSYV